jgi:regulatory protein
VAGYEKAYVDALKMLARRELSEAQVRQRLSRHGHDADAIDGAIAKLRAERAIDDTRTAEAIARTQSVRGRGAHRVRREIEAAGIARADAQHAVDEVFKEVDPDALLAAALSRRLRGRDQIRDDREFQRLYRYLISQGFDADRVVRALRARSRRGRDPSD